ncbi:long chain base biosynthesis protein 2d isoform X2 [Physcomitrium patens]|uniref:long chain base biosynthesis protein 2d isoform X2 n=1 Tax=Physcomitrium patens TaxID=3218 RepID=UPI003CCD3962
MAFSCIATLPTIPWIRAGFLPSFSTRDRGLLLVKHCMNMWFKEVQGRMSLLARVMHRSADIFENFFTRRMYFRVQDSFNRPTANSPDSRIEVIERVYNGKTCAPTNTTHRCLNLGSCNYLGFAAKDEYCTPQTALTLKKYGVSTCATRVDCDISISRITFKTI